MMNRIGLIIFFITFWCAIFAQDEYVTSLKQNQSLLHKQNQTKQVSQYNNLFFRSDTLSLPFVDEFSYNTLNPHDIPTGQSIDTVFYATGSCVLEQDFDTYLDSFNTQQTYTFAFNIALQKVDSVPTTALTFTYYNDLYCFDGLSTLQNFFPQTYYYSFDSTTGVKIDSILVPADTLLEYAEIYFTDISSSSMWVDDYAYWNKTFAKLPPTIGVATLDGLNEFGRPYNQSIVNPIGQADYLTSKPIDLSGLHNDSSVVISFFVQAKGFGDAPNFQDSIVLEFKNEYESQWIKVWGATTSSIPLDTFKQFFVQVRDTNLLTGPHYFYPNFQFRFRNKASLDGNNDHWNIDYVRLDKGRTLNEQDTVIRDVSFIYDFPNILNRYTQLPWHQLQAGADRFVDTISIPIHDNGQVTGISAGSFPIKVQITDSLDTDTIFELSGQNANASAVLFNQEFYPNQDFDFPLFDGDSICINAGMAIYPNARNLLTINDTTFSQVCLDKVMAYDDGSAERAFGIAGNANELKKFAYRFEVAQPDTLAGIQIHFTNINNNPSNVVFNLYAWDSIQVDVPLSYDNAIGVIENKTPQYYDYRNGFATFVFDTPVLVKDVFYIGWAQTDLKNIEVGYDKNSLKGYENMFVYTYSTWHSSTVTDMGSPMIRALLDADYDFPTANREIAKEVQGVHVYPNPTKNSFWIEIPKEVTDYEVNVFDISGRTIAKQFNTNQVDLSAYTAGIYFVKLSAKGNIYTAKIVKE